MNKVKPRLNEGPRNWQNMFAITRFRYIEVLSLIIYHIVLLGRGISFVIPRTLLHRASYLHVL